MKCPFDGEDAITIYFGFSLCKECLLRAQDEVRMAPYASVPGTREFSLERWIVQKLRERQWAKNNHESIQAWLQP